MSRLAQSWVENNFQLPFHINHLEKDFSNGYLFLHMLVEKQILSQDDFNDARNEFSADVIIHNMNLLGNALKNMNINLSRKLSSDVISILNISNFYYLLLTCFRKIDYF
jgi:hypothetical protein